MDLDEQMQEIERTIHDNLNLPWVVDNEDGTEVSDTKHCVIVETGGVKDNAYLVACANAAPGLVAEVRRLREDVIALNHICETRGSVIANEERLLSEANDELARLRALLARQEPVMTAAADSVEIGSSLEYRKLRNAVRELEKGGEG